ncbi:MAG: GNAT family N-acetyltransferase [Bdellovibrionales bacterium]
MKNKLIMRRLELQDEEAFFKALKQWDANSGFMFALGFQPGMKFSEYIDRLKLNEAGEQLPEGYVPDTSLSGFMDDVIVGRIAIRHRLNEFLLKIGGHIGYGVLPQFRGLGYAKQMLTQSLKVADKMSIKRVLVTCDDNNIGSIKTIEYCGGVLENKIDQGESKPLKRRYWIET